jgi:hypothetical protein
MRRDFEEHALKFKNPHWQEEREWRLICRTRPIERRLRAGTKGAIVYTEFPRLAPEGKSGLDRGRETRALYLHSVTIGPGFFAERGKWRATICEVVAKLGAKRDRTRSLPILVSRAPLK